MPVIVVGADSELGIAVVKRLQARAGEIRVFVSDTEVSQRFRTQGIKVAVGDVSDTSHVGAAAIGAFSAVLLAPAATDGRATAFAEPLGVVEGWLGTITGAGVPRIILVVDSTPPPLPSGVPEAAVVAVGSRSPDEVAEEVAALDEAARI